MVTPPSSTSSAPSSGGGQGWTISNEAKNNYAKLWDSLEKNPQGFLEGKSAAAFFAKSGHSREVLRTIWQLSDVNSDGKMDRTEFFIGMHLTMMVKKGGTLPSSLPNELLRSAEGSSGNRSNNSVSAPPPAAMGYSENAAAASASQAPALNKSSNNRLGESDRDRVLLAQLNEVNSQLKAETDRLRDLDGELVRLRAEVGE